jgi:N utilization substance protein B
MILFVGQLGVLQSLDELKSAGMPEFSPDDVISKEVIEHPQPTNDRTLARRIAVQVLYEVDSADHPVEEVIASQLNYHQPSRRIANYINRLVDGVLKNYVAIDHLIAHFAPEFPLYQVALVDRNILRIAIFEMLLDDRVPVGAAITEAVELAKLFGADGTPRFVNGVLGAITADPEGVKERLASMNVAAEDLFEENTDEDESEADNPL